MKFKQFLPPLGLFLLVMSFFIPQLMRGNLPIPADTIVGLYHPYRDAYAHDYPNGIPFKNFLTTDPVRQQYPWKYLGISIQKQREAPSWNPYTFSGTPLMANMQTGAFYPANLLFFFFSFPVAWGIFIILQPLLASLFVYLYLRNRKVYQFASVFGGFVFAFSGFSVAWLTWGNILHAALWLPLLLLSIDHLFARVKEKKSHESFVNRSTLSWMVVFILGLSSSLFAGHLQTFFYVVLIVSMYTVFQWTSHTRAIQPVLLVLSCLVLVMSITAVQWIPTMQFISESARAIDQADWQQDGWFVPWQHAVQFLVPDFYGNPTTLNYFGTWNYGELVGYVGFLPLLLAIFALLFKRTKEVWFFGLCILVAVLFAFPTGIASLPFMLQIPFLSSAQPTRLLFIIDFSLAILAAFGFDYLLKERKKVMYPLLFFVAIIAVIWILIILFPTMISSIPENVAVTKRNLQLPTLLIFITALFLIALLKLKNTRISLLLTVGLLLLTVADASRFAAKFIPFSPPSYLYPKTKVINFLTEHSGEYRYMTTDSRILPPNFSIMYGLQTVDGYDPLYLRRYGEFIKTIERGKPDISSPLGFNRIITPHDYSSPFIDFLGVKYILSLTDITDPTLKKVLQEGQTRIYENTEVFPRVFLVEEKTVKKQGDKQSVIDFLYTQKGELKTRAVVEGGEAAVNETTTYTASGSAEIISYSLDTIRIRVTTPGDAFLVLTDTYYPTWKAWLDPDTDKKYLPISRTNYAFRGVVVPSGEHIVEFTNTLL